MPGGIGRSSQSNQRTQRSRPANVEDRDRRQASVDEEPASNNHPNNNDPFGNWDIRKETNLRDRHNADLDERKDNNQDRGSNIFDRENEDEVAKENDELDTPPFFRRRRRDD